MAYSRRKYPDAFVFLADCEEELLKDEAEHSLMLGLASQLANGLLSPDDGTFFGSLWKDGVFAGAYMRSSVSKAILLSLMSEEASLWLAERLEEKVRQCVGYAPAVLGFAGAWAERHELGLSVEMEQGLYRLDAVEGHWPLEGESCVDARDLPFEDVVPFVKGFLDDCYPRLSEEKRVDDAKMLLEKNLKNGSVWLWRNAEGQLVALAARSRDTAGGATVSLVYTAPAHRRRGYAGRLVAALSRKILEDGKVFCVLYTDLSNPTSNSIYAKIGYRRIAHGQHFRFLEGE